MLVRSGPHPPSPVQLLWRYVSVAGGLVAVLAGWHLSDSRFASWKLRSIPRQDWQQMASDLERFGDKTVTGGRNFFPAGVPPPASLNALGSMLDYSGGVAAVWNEPEYTGIFAAIKYGYKFRAWGLVIGPEERAKSYSHNGRWFRVATNAYFFVGPGD